MSLTKDQKKELLTALTKQIKEAKSVIFADYQGCSVKEMKKLRDKLRENGVKFKVSKKTLIKIAAKEAGFADEIPDEVLTGPVGAAFCMEDEIVAAKLISNLSKEIKNLKLRGALFEGRVLSVKETQQLALIPSRLELLAKLVYMFNSPISRFHGVLHGTILGLVRVLNAIGEKKGKTA